MGKTKFFEILLENFIENNYKNKFSFSNIVIIDLWEFSSSKNMTNEIVTKIFEIIIKYNYDKKNNWNKFFIKMGQYFTKFLSFGGLLFLEYLTKNLTTNKWITDLFPIINDSLNNINKFKSWNKNMNNIIEKMSPIILVFDNLERLHNSYEIISLIQKVSKIPKLIIVISLNEEKLDINNNLKYSKDSNSNNETWINKYVTLGTKYKFEQSYTNFYIKKEFDIEFSEFLNKCTNKKSTIRELNNILSNEIILEIKEYFYESKYYAFIYLQNNLNNIFDIRDEDIIKEINKDIQKIKNIYISKLKKIWDEKKNKIWCNWSNTSFCKKSIAYLNQRNRHLPIMGDYKEFKEIKISDYDLERINGFFYN